MKVVPKNVDLDWIWLPGNLLCSKIKLGVFHVSEDKYCAVSTEQSKLKKKLYKRLRRRKNQIILAVFGIALMVYCLFYRDGLNYWQYL